MEFNENAQLDPSQVQPSSGGGRGTGIAVGGVGGILVLILSLFFGFNPSDLLGATTGSQNPQAPTSNAYAQCRTGADLKNDQNCRWVAYVNTIQSYWATQINGYEQIAMKPFSGQVQTACGTASSQVGPFYCPGDKTVYLDIAFLRQLFAQLGTKDGYGAEFYVLAHEFGHYISDLTGDMSRANQMGGTGPGSGQVRLELQADCFAGAAMKNAPLLENSAIAALSQDDLNNIVSAAKAVGDDHIQLQSTGGVSPEGWTHGSSAQRQYWVAKGYKAGNPNVCTTFAANAENV